MYRIIIVASLCEAFKRPLTMSNDKKVINRQKSITVWFFDVVAIWIQSARIDSCSLSLLIWWPRRACHPQTYSAAPHTSLCNRLLCTVSRTTCGKSFLGHSINHLKHMIWECSYLINYSNRCWLLTRIPCKIPRKPYGLTLYIMYVYTW